MAGGGDLAKNQDKAFRILVMHHPISDPYTKMHIAPVDEAGHVDMMLAGHTHSYARAVSDQPTVGAGTIYLTHQDSRAVSAKGSYMTHTIKDGVKTLEPGESIELSGTVTLTEIGKHTVKVADASKDIEVRFRPATFSYTNVRTKLGNGEVSDINSDILNIKADITNIGNEDGTATATLYVGDEATLSKQYALKADEVKTCEFFVCIGDSSPETVYIEGSI